MHKFAIVLVGCAVAFTACSTDEDSAAESSGGHSEAAAAVEIRDGFTLPSGIDPGQETHLAIPGAPNETWSYTLPGDVDAGVVESALVSQLDANGYALTVDNDTGFAARADDGRELALIVIDLGSEKAATIQFSRPN